MSAATSACLPRGARIAIAVQDYQIRHLLAMILRLEGYQPQELADGTRVMDALLSQPYAAAIVDLRLAPGDGPTVCRRIQEMEAVATTPVILLLMIEDMPEHTSATQLGASAVLFLPFQIQDVLNCVSRVLQSEDPSVWRGWETEGDQSLL